MNILNKKLKASLFLCLVLTLVSCATHTKENDAKTELYTALAEYLNESCPTQIAEGVILKAVTYSKKETSLVYIYTLTSSAKSDSGEAEWKVIKASTRIALIDEFKARQDLEQFRKDGIVLTFHYNDKNGAALFTVKLSPDEY